MEEAEEEAMQRIRGYGQDRAGGGLVCMSMRFTASNPKGAPPSLHVTRTPVADNQANQEQEQEQTQALSGFMEACFCLCQRLKVWVPVCLKQLVCNGNNTICGVH